MRTNPKLQLKVNQTTGRRKSKKEKAPRQESSGRPKGSTMNSYVYEDFVSFLSYKYNLSRHDFKDGPDETITGQFAVVDTSSSDLAVGWREAIRKEFRDAYIVLRRY